MFEDVFDTFYRHMRPLRLASALILLVVCQGVHAAGEPEWGDIEARIDFGYYTQDARTLRSIADTLSGGGKADPERDYYRGFVQYRLLLLATQAGNGKDAAKDAAERCVDSLAEAIKARPGYADALALQSGCLGILSGLKPWKAPLLGPKSGTQLQQALKLAPRDPRVLLVDALADDERPAFAGGDKERAFGKFQKAVDAFEAERQGLTRLPGWGAPEAYYYLARSSLARGDAQAARVALERALLLAPDFALARQMMVRITS